jgi:flagellar biosynthesis chaperone FliJ
MVEAVKQQFPDLGKDLFLPEDFPGMKARGDEAATRIAIAKQAGTDISPEDLKIYAQSRGITEPLETVGEITKARAEKEALAQRQIESGLIEKQIPLREREVTAHEVEVGLKGTGKKTPKELQTLLENKLNKRQTSIQKLRSLAPSDIQNVRNYEIYIDQLNNEIAGLKKTLGPENAVNQATELDKKYQPIVDALKARGITRQALLQNKDLEKDLMTQGFTKWIILEYLK